MVFWRHKGIRDDWFAMLICYLIFEVALVLLVIVSANKTGALYPLSSTVPSAIFLGPHFCKIPFCFQKVYMDNEKIRVRLWFITLKTISLSEVKQAGLAIESGGDIRKMIFVSKRLLVVDELQDTKRIKDKKNVITIYYQDDIKNALASLLPVGFIDEKHINK